MSADFKNLTPLSKIQNRESWLTKDRFWNFVFWIGMSGGFSLAPFVKFTLGLPEFVPYILILNIIIFPILIMYFNKTDVVNNRIVNSENIKLSKKQLPTASFIPLTIISIIISGFLADKYATIGSVLSSFLFFSGLLSGSCLYFIVKNCPITILFNRKLWEMLSRNIPKRTSNIRKDTFTDPSYSFLSHNIFHKKR